MSVSVEETAYRLATAQSISVVALAVGELRGEVRAMRWTLTGLGTGGVVLLSGILAYLIR